MTETSQADAAYAASQYVVDATADLGMPYVSRASEAMIQFCLTSLGVDDSNLDSKRNDQRLTAGTNDHAVRYHLSHCPDLSPATKCRQLIKLR
jgi:hypothetical protein